MPDTITVALITAAGSVLGSYFINLKNKKEDAVKTAVREEEQTMRLTSIENKIEMLAKKVDSHNGYAEKFADASRDIALTQKDVASLQKSFDTLMEKCTFVCNTK